MKERISSSSSVRIRNELAGCIYFRITKLGYLANMIIMLMADQRFRCYNNANTCSFINLLKPSRYDR